MTIESFLDLRPQRCFFLAALRWKRPGISSEDDATIRRQCTSGWAWYSRGSAGEESKEGPVVFLRMVLHGMSYARNTRHRT
jgi:hypothetical protein